MFDFISLQYQMEQISADQVRQIGDQGWITMIEAERIIWNDEQA